MNLLDFMLSQFQKRDFWLLFLASTTMFFMWWWRNSLRDSIFWEVGVLD